MTIPEEINTLDYYALCKGDCEKIRKVVLPFSGIHILNGVFEDCVNLEELENFPPKFHYDEYIVDEETGESIHFVEDHPCEVFPTAFQGCSKLYPEKQRTEEDGTVWLDMEGTSYYIGIPKSTSPFYDEMCAYITEKYLKSGIAEKAAFSFDEKITRYGVEYEYLFENGALYNKTNGTWILYLSQYSDKKQKYKPQTLANGETKVEMLTRSRNMLAQSGEKWGESKKERAGILFDLYPQMSEGCSLICKVRSIFKEKITPELAKVKLHEWCKEVSACTLREIKAARDCIKAKEQYVLNCFEKRSTNAAAESLDSKIKGFRAQLHGIADIPFFLYRVCTIFG